MRVTQLTDLHVGLVTPDALVAEAVQIAVDSAPDVVALTGDFVAHTTGALGRLQKLRAPLPGRRIAVLGNHDHRAGADRVAAALAEIDVTVLDNAWTWLDDHAIGLSHHPAGAPDLWDRGVPLVLSGHTHGGQVHHPRWTPALFEKVEGTRHVTGMCGEPGRQVYVCPGIGAAVVPWRAGTGARRSVAVLDVEGAG
jgi:predicted MPP superfamily phosphohydrolase